VDLGDEIAAYVHASIFTISPPPSVDHFVPSSVDHFLLLVNLEKIRKHVSQGNDECRKG